jgi:hypothetical protein
LAGKQKEQCRCPARGENVLIAAYLMDARDTQAFAARAGQAGFH